MKDPTSRRLILIFGLCILLSIGAIAIGFMGMADLLDSGFVNNIQTWIQPIISIRPDEPTLSYVDPDPEGIAALDVEATQMASKQGEIEEIFSQWPVVLEDDFSGNDLGWSVFDQEADLANLSVEILNGKYRWTAKANQGFVWWSYPDFDPFTDFFAELDVAQTQGSLNGEIGLVFRLTDDQYYLFEISGGEYFSLWRSDPDGWSGLFDWTASSTIRPTGSNRLGILALEDHFYMFINDVLVGEISDGQLASGLIGVAIGLDEAGKEGQFEFDNLSIRIPAEDTLD